MDIAIGHIQAICQNIIKSDFMKLSECKLGTPISINHPISFMIGYISAPIGIITSARGIINDKNHYQYTVEHGKRKKIYTQRISVGIMLTNGKLVFEDPNHLRIYKKK